MSELALRILFALVAAPVALLVVLAGGWPLAILLAIVCAIGAWEFFRIARATGATPLDDAGIALAGATPLVLHAHHVGLVNVRFALVAVLSVTIMAITIWQRGVEGKPLSAVSTTIFGVLYASILLSFGYAIRYHDVVAGLDYTGSQIPLGFTSVAVTRGGLLLILPLVVTWASDIGAFFVGRTLKGPKLIPSVSPGKTISGAIGGVLGSMLASYAYTRSGLSSVAGITMSASAALTFGLIISVAAQAGDLFESLLKRESGMKDSSRILPGHGGILDRFDSLIFVLPVAYVLLSWLPISGLR